jgi:hypothetical protein
MVRSLIPGLLRPVSDVALPIQPCAGKISQTCGGSNRLSVYAKVSSSTSTSVSVSAPAASDTSASLPSGWQTQGCKSTVNSLACKSPLRRRPKSRLTAVAGCFSCSAHRRHRRLAPPLVGVVYEPEDNQHPCGLHRSLRCRRLQLRRHAERRPCVDPGSSSGCSRGASADRAFRAAARSSRMLLRLDAQRLWQDRHHCGRLVLPSRRLSGRCFAEVRRPLLHAALQIEPGRSFDIVLRTDRVQHSGCRTAGLAA